MSDIGLYVGQKIRELREAAHLSQTALATKLKVTPNTISRWESGVYRPQIDQLEGVARTLNSPLWAFFPVDIQPPREDLKALLSASGDLPAEDIQELIRYVDFLRGRDAYRAQGHGGGKGKRRGSKDKV